jgi:hypothetical protein
MLEVLKISDFAEHVNSKFQMHINEATAFEVELVEAKKHGATESPYQFSLKFAAPLTAPPSQGLYRLEHEKMGELQLFLVPVAKDKEWLYYEAVFNNPQ